MEQVYMSLKFGSSKRIRDYSILISILIIIGIIQFIFSKGGINSGAYFFSAFNIIILFIIPFPFSLMEIVSKYVRSRMDNYMFRNAKRVIYFSILISCIYSISSSLILFILNNWICDVLLVGKKCSLTFILLLPLIIFTSISCVIKGFFRGSKLKSKLYLSIAIEILSMFIGVLLFSNIFESIGNKIVGVLYDTNINDAFFSAGVALGLSFGSFVDLVVSILIFNNVSKELIKNDNTKRLEDIYDLGLKLFSEALLLGLSSFISLLFLLGNQIIFKIMTTKQNNNLLNYDMGIYYGIFYFSVLCPLLFTFIYSYIDRRIIRIGYSSNDRLEIRAKISTSIKQFFIYSVPFTMYVLIMADYLAPIIIAMKSDMAVNILRYGIITAIFIGVGAISQNILLSINRNIVSILVNIIAIAADVATFIFISKTKDIGIYTFIISTFIYAIIYAILSYLSVKKYMKYKPYILNNLLKPLISGLFIGIITLILRLVLGLFAPIPVILLITAIVDFIAAFIIMYKLKTFSYQAAKRSAIGFILIPLGDIFKIFKNKE